MLVADGTACRMVRLMRAIVVREVGGPEVLTLVEDAPEPVAGPGDVVVDIEAIGVNFADTERRRGVYGPPELPYIPGREAAGTVVRVGPGVDEALVGARVAYFSPRASGSYAERARVPVQALVRFAGGTDMATMAALPQQALTAAGVLALSQIRPNQIAIVLAAAGGVGQMLVQLVRRAGARVIAVVSSEAKRAWVAELADHVIVGYDGFAEHARRITEDRGVDVVFDSIGRATQQGSMAALGVYGQLVYYGDASGMPEPIDVDALYKRCLRIGAFGLDLDRDPDHIADTLRDLASAVETGEVRVSVSQRYPLADARRAHEELETRRSVGKIVLLPRSR